MGGVPGQVHPRVGKTPPPGRYIPHQVHPPGTYPPAGRYSPWAGTPQAGTPQQVHHPRQVHPKAGTSPRYTPRQVHIPRQVHPLGSYTPWAGIHPQAGTPPGRYTRRSNACWKIHATSGRYVSHWNAFLFKIEFYTDSTDFVEYYFLVI